MTRPRSGNKTGSPGHIQILQQENKKLREDKKAKKNEPAKFKVVQEAIRSEGARLAMPAAPAITETPFTQVKPGKRPRNNPDTPTSTGTGVRTQNKFRLLTDGTRSLFEATMPAINNKSRWGQKKTAQIRSAIDELTSRESVYAKKSRRLAFKTFCKSRKYKIGRHTSISHLADILEDYAFNMRRQDGKNYKEGTIKAHWNTTAKYLMNLFLEKYGKKFNPYHDLVFARARAARDGKRRILRADPTKRTESCAVLTHEEYSKMIRAYDPDTPEGLMKRLCLLLGKDLAWRGKEAHKVLLTYFEEETQNDGTPTGNLKYNPIFSKTHPGGNKPLAVDKWVFPNNENPSECPVRLFKKMVSLRPADAPNKLFLHPNPSWQKSGNFPWYTNNPVGEKSMRTWVKKAAERIGLKGNFTNHSARYTAATHLAKARVPAHLAMHITGHKNVSTLQRYVRVNKEDVQEIIGELRSRVKNTPGVVDSVPGPSKGHRNISCLQPYVHLERENLQVKLAQLRSGVNNTTKPYVAENFPGLSRGHRNTRTLQPYVRLQKENLQEKMALSRLGINTTTKPCVAENFPELSRVYVSIQKENLEKIRARLQSEVNIAAKASVVKRVPKTLRLRWPSEDSDDSGVV